MSNQEYSGAKNRVYTLYRVSTLGQVEKDDIPMQKTKCRAFAEEKGWMIIKEFAEKGVSGYKVTAKDRDAIQEIQKAAVAGKFDILLVFMFDRLGRRDDETPFVVEWFVKCGIEVWSCMEGQQRFDSHVDTVAFAGKENFLYKECHKTGLSWRYRTPGDQFRLVILYSRFMAFSIIRMACF